MGQGFRINGFLLRVALGIAVGSITLGSLGYGPDLSYAESSTDVYFGTEEFRRGRRLQHLKKRSIPKSVHWIVGYSCGS